MAARLSAAATIKPAVREEPHVEAEPAQEHDPFVVRFPSSRPPPAERANGAVDGAIWPEVGSASEFIPLPFSLFSERGTGSDDDIS